MDVTAVVAAITAASTPIASIGGAVLLVIVGIATYKWVRRAI
jgi:Inovirus Coat protein B